MTYVCNPVNFPAATYFAQHEIPASGPTGYDYEYIRGLVIEANGKICGVAPDEDDCVAGVLDGLSMTMIDQLTDNGPFPGVKKVGAVTWESKIPELFARPLVQGNPFDFQLWFSSRVAIFLVGGFWRFSTKMAPFTTKHQYADQYFDLLLHHVDNGPLASLTREQWAAQRPTQPCRCISFYTGMPCRDSALPPPPVSPQVLHGFSLNIELGALNTDGTVNPTNVLPITFDPDIENKGGHG